MKNHKVHEKSEVWSQMKALFTHVTFHCFLMSRGVLFLSYSQLKPAISDRAHVGTLEFQRGCVSGRMRAHQMSMG